MNSLFDPECHRQVLGNRQARGKGTKRGREEGELVLQGEPGSVGQSLQWEAAPRLHWGAGRITEVPSTSPG